MPNTLAHIAVQGLANAAWQPSRYVPWVLLGCVLPDVPWIAARALRLLSAEVDAVALALYGSVQASLLFCMLLAVAAAAFARRPLIVWALLAANSLLHLLLDAVEIKPGSAPLLLAPYSWQGLAFGWLRPEHALVTGVTLAGLVVALGLLFAPRFREPLEPLVLSGVRAGVAACALAAYLVLPLPLGAGAWDADYRSIRTLATSDVSIRSRVEIDRDPIVRRNGDTFLQTLGREFRLITDRELPDGATVSLVGHVSAPYTIRAAELHVSSPVSRDVASIAGLLVVAAVWARLLARSLEYGGRARPQRSLN